MKKLKLGFVGLGQAANHYISIIDSFFKNDIELSAAVESDMSKHNSEIASRFLSVTHDIKYLDPDIADLFVVLSPSGNHAIDSYKLLSQRFNVLCEKPITMSIDQGIANIKLAEKEGLEYGGVFQNRYNLPIKFAKSLLNNQQLGKILYASTNLFWSRPQEYYDDGWHGTWKHDGGVINQQAIHHIDALFYLVGSPHNMFSQMGNFKNNLEAEDTHLIQGKLNNSGYYNIFATTGLKNNDLEASIKIVGDKGLLEIAGQALNRLKNLIIDSNEASSELLQKNSEDVMSGFGNGHRYLLEEIIANWKDSQRIKLPITANDALNATRFVHSFYASNEEKRLVEFSEDLSSSKLGI